MIQHLFKIIWHERKTNAWIVLEFIVVFCILWFCIDYFYFLGKSYFEYSGYDDKHTYIVDISANSLEQEPDEDTQYSITNTLLERIRNYPGVECVSISSAAIPYAWSSSSWGVRVNNDSTYYTAQVRRVTPDFFKVFKIEFERGKAFSPYESDKELVVFPDRNGKFGEYPNASINAMDMQTISYGEKTYNVSGVTQRVRTHFLDPFYSGIFIPMEKDDISPEQEIVIRVSPQADNTDFVIRFSADMKAQLAIPPYSFTKLSKISERKEQYFSWRADNNVKSISAIIIFLVANILLGIIGTFWVKVQSHKAETGLRLALGASKKQIRWMMLTEALLMLFLASIVSTYICLNLGQTEILQGLGIPLADRVMAGIGSGQDFINYIVTFVLLALLSGIAVWFPAKLSTDMNPADALREE
ncbi:ABC transporter permease [Bacteroides sp. 519]|uniref:ABC transporter permease n=1 Tax=Bacteroides sp. 519 TaxID=2302937 RepID=UPI0013D07E74|nr:FtsX-like permease family protein [Bacteroides sp. 519]NDV59874.1 ABC transporter permease [Bacteroides sp. 519]